MTYLEMGDAIRRGGLFTPWPFSELRTYVYPSFVAVASTWAGITGLDAHGVVFLLQLLLHVTASLFLNSALRGQNPFLAQWTLVGVLCNPFLLVYVPESLTESLSVTAAITLLAVLVHASAADTRRSALTLWAFAGLIVGSAVMIRPANLPLGAATIAVFIWWCLRQRSKSSAGLSLAVLCLAIVLPMGPQLALNSAVYDRFTPFPVVALGQFQMQTGLELMKYATSLSGGGAAAPYYNPWAPSGIEAPSVPLEYYLAHPIAGARLGLLHVFNSLNHDYLFTYISDPDPLYRPFLLMANHAVVFSGFSGLALLMMVGRRNGRNAMGGGLKVALLITTLSVCALNAVVAVEVRFGVLALLTLSIAAVIPWTLLRTWSGLRRTIWLSGLFTWTVFALWLSDWVLGHSPVLGPR